MSDRDVNYDKARQARIGMPEAVFCEGKTPEQIESAVAQALTVSEGVLLTRLSAEVAEVLSVAPLDYDIESRTGIVGAGRSPEGPPDVAVVAAGSSDLPVAREAIRTLGFLGISAQEYADVGVAGLWRLLEIREELTAYRVVIAVAGMEGAMFTVLGGLIPGLIIAVPTSIGYGVARDGAAALHSALASCAQGIVAVNIDNGFGAACAATRILGPSTE